MSCSFRTQKVVSNKFIKSQKRNDLKSEQKIVRDVVYIKFVENLMCTSFKIFVENIVRGNSVQIGPNFPAKSLSIYTKSFSGYLLSK